MYSFLPPQELCDLIVIFLRHDTKSLIRCSLVSKAWLSSARPHLFGRVRLNQHNVDEFTCLVLNSNATLPSRIKRLELAPDSLDVRWLRRLVPFVGMLEVVSTLCLDNIEWCLLPCWSKMNFTSSLAATVTNLHLKSIIFNRFTDFLGIVCAFPALYSLSLDTLRWGTSPLNLQEALENNWFLAPSLKSLRLYSCHVKDVLRWILSHPTIPVVHNFEIGPLKNTHIPFVGPYVRHLNSDLRSMAFGFGDDADFHMCGGEIVSSSYTEVTWASCSPNTNTGMPFPCPSNIHALVCPNLRTLTGLESVRIARFIYYTDHQYCGGARWVIRLLASIRSPELTMVLEVWLSSVEDIDHHFIDWKFFDCVATAEGSQQIKEIRFEVGGTVDVYDFAVLISSRLPHCSKRKMITFDYINRLE